MNNLLVRSLSGAALLYGMSGPILSQFMNVVHTAAYWPQVIGGISVGLVGLVSTLNIPWKSLIKVTDSSKLVQEKKVEDSVPEVKSPEQHSSVEPKELVPALSQLQELDLKYLFHLAARAEKFGDAEALRLCADLQAKFFALHHPVATAIKEVK